jgi:hypothetical protein
MVVRTKFESELLTWGFIEAIELRIALGFRCLDGLGFFGV